MGNCISKNKESKKNNAKHKEKHKSLTEEHKPDISQDLIHRHVGNFIETDSK